MDKRIFWFVFVLFQVEFEVLQPGLVLVPTPGWGLVVPGAGVGLIPLLIPVMCRPGLVFIPCHALLGSPGAL